MTKTNVLVRFITFYFSFLSQKILTLFNLLFRPVIDKPLSALSHTFSGMAIWVFDLVLDHMRVCLTGPHSVVQVEAGYDVLRISIFTRLKFI
jgi:hypothetical protein